MDLDRDEPIGHEPDVETRQRGDASIQQRCARQNDDGDRHLPDHEEAARPVVLSASGAGAAAIPKRLLEWRRPQREQRHERAHGGHERADAHGVDERACADHGLFDSRKIQGNDGQEHWQRGARNHERGAARERRQQRRLPQHSARNRAD